MNYIKLNPRKLGKALDLLCLVILGIFAFYLCFKAGQKGFFAFDQSPYFDGGYRILSGQIPYKDFVMPMGLVTFWIQALCFRIMGVNYLAYLLHAAFANVVATYLSIIILRIGFPYRKSLSYIAGILTAIWFYPIFGTPSDVQTSFFFSFASIVLILAAMMRSSHNRMWSLILLGLSGCFSCVSFFSKQSSGLIILPLFFLLIMSWRMPKIKPALTDILAFFLGLVGSGIIIALWVWEFSDLKLFYHYVFQMPYEIAIGRLGNERFIYRSFPLLPGLLLLLSFIVGISFYFYYIAIHRMKKLRRTTFLFSVLCFYCAVFQFLFIHITRNQWENGLPFIGIMLATALGIIFDVMRIPDASSEGKINDKSMLPRFWTQRVIGFIAIFILVYVSVLGMQAAMNRKAHETIRNAKSWKYLEQEKLKHLKWAEPTKIRGREVKAKHLLNLIGYLEKEDKNFFIFPEFALLYGVLNKPSPQPLVWFQKGITYSDSYDKSLDQWIVSDLRRNVVEIAVLEATRFSKRLMKDFPKLKTYIKQDFEFVRRFGFFEVFKKKAPSVGE